MKAPPVAHPSDYILQAFSAEKLDGAAILAVVAHLESCSPCRDRAVRLTGVGILNRLRIAPPAAKVPGPSESAYRTVPPTADRPHVLSPSVSQAQGAAPPELLDHPQYEVLSELGCGGMGVVYLAKNKKMDRLEVLKVVNRRLLSQSGAVERFLREIRSAAKLSHANIVTAYSMPEAGELLVFAMEHVQGEDLDKLVKANGPLPVTNACFYAYQVAKGLQHAHEKGMVHRDIKPSNLIVARMDKKHLVKILDFGLAKATREEEGASHDLTGSNMLGTPLYMAPEQARDAAHADIRADVYSLGCTLYFLLTGQPPFREKSLFELLNAHHSKEAAPVDRLRKDVPPALTAVVAKMMAKERSQRYADPNEVAQALQPFCTSGLKPLSGKATPPDGVKTGTPGAATETNMSSDIETIAPPPVAEIVLDVLPADTHGGGSRRTGPVPTLRETVAGGDATGDAARNRSGGARTGPHRLSRDTIRDGEIPVVAARRTASAAKGPKKRRGLLLGGALVGCVLLLVICILGLWIAGVFRGKEKPSDDATILAEDVAEVEKLYQAGKGSKEYIDRVGPGRFPIWRTAAERGSPEAQWLLSRCYQEGIGVPKDAERAVALLRKAADKGNRYAENNLGYCYYNGVGVGQNQEEGVRWFRKSADKGLAIAQKNLAMSYRDGAGVPQNWDEARKWYRRAGEGGDPTALYQLGAIYFNGQGLAKPDQEEGVRWFRKAADAGDGDAQDELGKIYGNGWGVAKDLKQAAIWYRRSAEGGNVYGQGNLGRAYLLGEGVDQNDEEAIRWLEKAVAQNVKHAATNRECRWNLGCALNNRGGTFLKKKDDDDAFRFYRRAADVREKLVEEVPYNFLHRSNLGGSYRGLGDVRLAGEDYKSASKWYIKASDLGDGKATRQLADLFEKGQGVPKDPSEATRLRKLADKQKIIRFTIPCPVKGMPNKVPQQVYITDAFKGTHPVEEEEHRLLEDYNATLPKEVKDSFNRLYEISRQNNVSFRELCVYALESKDKEKK